MKNLENFRYIPLIKFLDSLRQEGFDIGVDTHLHFAKILKTLSVDSKLEEVAFKLAPLVARNQAEQEKFYQLFEQQAKTLLQYTLEEFPQQEVYIFESELPKSKNTVQKEEQVKVKSIVKKKEKNILVDLARAALILAFLFLLFKNQLLPSKQQSLIGQWERIEGGLPGEVNIPMPELDPFADIEGSSADENFGKPVGVFNDTTHKVLLQPIVINLEKQANRLNNQWQFKIYQQKRNIKLALVALLLSSFFFYQIRRYVQRIRKRRGEKKIIQQDTSFKLPLKIENKTPLNFASQFHTVMNQFRQREKSDRSVLNMKKTIVATAKSGGIIDFQYDQLTKSKEYLILIDKEASEETQLSFFEQIFQTLAKNDVYAERFFFAALPNICWNDDYPQGLSSEELYLKYGHCRLLIFSTGEEFFDSDTSKIKRDAKSLLLWDNRVILTPKNMSDWSVGENDLESQFKLLPSDMSGFSQVMNHLENNNTTLLKKLKTEINESTSTIFIDKNRIVQSLQIHFNSELQRWIAACAVYPTLTWDLIMRLGQVLSTAGKKSIVNYTNISKLARLEWFQKGKIPDEARTILLNNITAFSIADERLVRAEIRDILKKNIPEEGTDTYEQYQLFAASNELLTQPKTKRKKQLLKKYRKLHDRNTPEDIIHLDRLREMDATVDILVPQSMRKYVFEEGNQILGIKNWVSFALVAFLAFLIMIPKFYYLPYEDIKAIDGNYFSTSSLDGKVNFSKIFSQYHYNQGVKAYQQNFFDQAKRSFNKAIAYENFYVENKTNTSSNLAMYQHALGAAHLYANEIKVAQQINSMLQKEHSDFLKSNFPNLNYYLTYDFIGEGREGYFRVAQNGKFGYLNKKGELSIPLKFDHAADFHDEKALVKMGEQLALINSSGEIVKNINKVQPFQKNKLWGLQTAQGDVILVANFDSLSTVINNDRRLVDKNNRFGYLDELGNMAIALQFEKAKDFENGFAEVEQKGQKFYIRADGVCVKNCPKDEAENFAKWRYFRDQTSKLYGFKNSKGEIVIPAQYDDAQNFLEIPVARVKKGKKWACIDTKGQLKTDFRYLYIESFSHGFAKVTDGRKFGFINQEGEAITPLLYDHAFDFQEGYGLVKIGLKSGYINEQGLPITPIEFDEAAFFVGGVAQVKKGKEIYLIDRTGQRIQEK